MSVRVLWTQPVCPAVVVLEHRRESLLVVPPVVERLEDDFDVLAGEAVQVGDDGVKLLDLLLFRVLVERTVFDAHRVGPIGKTVSCSRKPARQINLSASTGVCVSCSWYG